MDESWRATLDERLGTTPGEERAWTQTDLQAIRESLKDQGDALDSLERRAVTLMQPAAFILALGINNVTRVGAHATAKVLYYAGMSVLIGAIIAGGLVLFPRRPLRDPTLTPPRHPDAVAYKVVPLMLASADRNLRGYALKTLGLRAQLVALVSGSVLMVGALASLS